MIVTSLFFESLLLGCFDKSLFNLESCFAQGLDQCFWLVCFEVIGIDELVRMSYTAHFLVSMASDCFDSHNRILICFFYLFIFGLRALLNEQLTLAVKLSQMCSRLLLPRSPFSPGVKSTLILGLCAETGMAIYPAYNLLCHTLYLMVDNEAICHF